MIQRANDITEYSAAIEGGNKPRGERMSDIDPEKLAAAIAWMESHTPYGIHSDVLAAAARAHLATLPRFKEVEVEAWAAIYPDGEMLAVHRRQEAAAQHLPNGAAPQGFALVRLTGTAKVKVKQ